MNPDCKIIWLSSYPKSGNTWVRFLLYNLILGVPELAADVEQFIPDIHMTLSNINGISLDDILSCDTLIVKTHFSLTTIREKLSELLFSKTVGFIYILRNPIDVMLSNLNYSILQSYSSGIIEDVDAYSNRYIDSYITERGIQGRAKVRFGTWPEHVSSWLDDSHGFPYLLLKYEELITDPRSGVIRLSDFLEIEQPTSEKIDEILLNSSFDAMQQIENRAIATQEIGMFYTPEYEAAHQAGFRFMNKGQAGQSKVKLTSEQIERATQAFRPLMEKYGYV